MKKKKSTMKRMGTKTMTGVTPPITMNNGAEERLQQGTQHQAALCLEGGDAKVYLLLRQQQVAPLVLSICSHTL
jgi:hypothetical protein